MFYIYQKYKLYFLRNNLRSPPIPRLYDRKRTLLHLQNLKNTHEKKLSKNLQK